MYAMLCLFREQTEESVPAARAHHTVSYVESNGLVVLYGGHDGAQMCSDVWLFHIETGFVR